jgi:protein transport protein SEC23
MPDFTTIEYILPPAAGQPAPAKPIFLLMVDTAVDSEELSELKDSLQQSINFIPEDALIGLVTYGRMVFVHELGFQHCPKAYVFKGDKVITPADIKT